MDMGEREDIGDLDFELGEHKTGEDLDYCKLVDRTLSFVGFAFYKGV
jgi:hypothetical protein